VRKKITAIYADGSSKMNLGIATVVRMLKGATNVPVEVAADAAALYNVLKSCSVKPRAAGGEGDKVNRGLFIAAVAVAAVPISAQRYVAADVAPALARPRT
jgi:hypothetical protein